jgi:tetratricopeptide (TPR) repeat protein
LARTDQNRVSSERQPVIINQKQMSDQLSHNASSLKDSKLFLKKLFATEKESPFIEKIFSKNWIPFVVIATLGVILYFQVFFFDFTYLDDNNLILDNQYFLADWTNIFQAFLTDVFHLFNHSAFYYRPLLTISLMLDYHIGGTSPLIYHLTNVLLHIVASCLVFVFLTKLNYRKTVSFLFSLVFLTHPVLTQAVAWIPGRNDSLLAVFILLAFIYFIDFFKKRLGKDLALHMLFFGLAIFTKETALFGLFILFFYFYFIEKDTNLTHKKSLFIGWGTILALWLILRSLALEGSTPMGFADMLKSLFLNSPAVIQFIGKIFFPFNLSVLPIIQDTSFAYGIVALVLLTLLLFLTKNKRWNYVLFGLFWFAVFLFPSFIRPNPSLVADFIEHRLYLPIIGFFIILLELVPLRNWQKNTRIYFGLALAIILGFCVLTFLHSRNFSNRLAFWKNATQNSPHYPLAHRNLGAMEYLDGDMDSAEREFKITLKLNPQEEMAHNNLGLIYVNKNRLAEAEEEYKKELEINPYYDNAFFNLGLLYWQQEKYAEAESSWKKTLGINPNHIDALNALAIYYYSQKNYKEAALYIGELYRRGVKLPPEFLRLLQSSLIR